MLPVLPGYLVAAGCFYWIFHDIDFHEFLRSLEGIVWWRLVPVILLDLASYFIVAYQWQLLLKPLGNLEFWDASRAVFAGRFANDVLPVQLGYLIRIYMAARCLGKDFAAVIPSLLIERLLDGCWLAIGILALTFLVALPSYLITARNILGAVLSVSVLLVLLVTLRKSRRPPKETDCRSRWKSLARLTRFFARVVEGVRMTARSRMLPAVTILGAAKLIIQGLAYSGVIWAYGLHSSIVTGLAIFLIAYLGITVPSTPASAGVFQFFSVLGLELFGVSKTTASGLSLLAFVVLTAPLALAGFVAVVCSGMKWHELQAEVVRLKERMKA